MEKHTFADLGISPDLLQAIQSLGFEQPSPIQAQAIPVALTGRDVVGQSQTGSGKTMAFGIPLAQRIDPAVRGIQGLILCPTRELAMQVCTEIHKIVGFMQGVRATPVYGGASYDRQIRALQGGAQIVVGTPGRIVDFMERGYVKLDKLKTLVFDEADEMLDMGFRDEIEHLMQTVPQERQTIFFSATFEPRIRDLISRYTRNPQTITIEHKALTVPTVEQRYYEVHGRSKVEVLCRVLDMEAPRLTIVFANTKRAVDDTTDALIARGFAADRLHGDLNQMMRERVMRNFRNGTIEVLVATDVAARGLDVNDVDLIVNFELPYDEEDYVHRIGRTGRAGRSGKAISFVGGREIYLMQRIQRYINIRINRAKVPSQEEVEANRVDQTFEKLKATLESGEYAKHEATIQRLLDAGFDATDISSALLDLWMKESSREGEEIMEDRKARGADPKNKRERDVRPARAQTAAHAPAAERTEAAPTTHAAPVAESANHGSDVAPVEPQSQTQEAATADQAPAQPAHEAPAADAAPEREHEAPRPQRPVREERDSFDDDFEPRPKHQRSFVQKGPRSGMVRLFINLGGMDGIRPGDIAGLIYNTAKLEPGSVGTIDVFDKCSYLEVPEAQVEQVMSTVTGQNVRGRDVRMDFADRQDGGGMERPRRAFGGPRRPGGFGGGKPGGFKSGGFGGGGGGGGFGGGGGGGFGKKPFGKKPFGGGGGGKPFGRKEHGGDEGGRRSFGRGDGFRPRRDYDS
jgi:ATP-dependent RNA helicase DeaD